MKKITNLISKFLNLGFYVSSLDKFLNEYSRSHKDLSRSQRQEVDKYNRIYRMRDNPEAGNKQEHTFWDKF